MMIGYDKDQMVGNILSLRSSNISSPAFGEDKIALFDEIGYSLSEYKVFQQLL